MQNLKTLPRVHLNGCQGVMLFLPKDYFRFCQKLSFWVLSQFEFEFGQSFSFSLITIFFEVFVAIEVLSLVALLGFFFTIQVEFYHNLSFCNFLQFEFLSFVAIWVLMLCHNISFELCHNLSFGVLLQLEFLSRRKIMKTVFGEIGFFWWT